MPEILEVSYLLAPCYDYAFPTWVKLADSPLRRQFKKSPKDKNLANPEWDKITSRRQNEVTN